MDNNEQTVLVTPRSLSAEGHPALQKLRDAGFTVLAPWPGRQPGEEELLRVLPECVAYLAGVERITAQVLKAATKLKIISRNGVGMDNIDLHVAEQLGIVVKGTPGANSQGVAELALALVLAGMRSIIPSAIALKNGAWWRSMGTEIEGKTLGIVGCGNIGKRLAHMAIGIGMDVVGYDLYPQNELAHLKGFSYVDMPTLLSRSDAISLHCPPMESPLLERQSLSLVRKGVVIVNTARDALVDHEAMLEGIENGTVAAYMTDVFAKEPPEQDALLAHERVWATCHIGGYTKESVERATVGAVENILTYFNYKEPV